MVYRRFLIFSFLIIFTIIYGCSENKGSGSNLLDSNGLSKDINDFVPDSLLHILDSLGMPINTGDNPPNIEGTFLITPFTMVNTNRVNDNYYIGQVISDFYVKFSEQNNGKLTVNIDYYNGGEEGNGIGSFIVGDANKFSVFSKLFVTYLGDSADVLVLFSGSLGSDGLHDMYVANFMVNSYGSYYFINNGEGRIFYDSDGLSLPTTDIFTKAATFKNSDINANSAFKR